MQNLIDHLSGASETVALITEAGETVTRRDLSARLRGIGDAMASAPDVGDRLAILSPRGANTAIVQLALFERVAILPLNPDARHTQTAETLALSGATGLVLDSALDTAPLREAMAAAGLSLAGGVPLNVSAVLHRLEGAAPPPPNAGRRGLVLHTAGSTGAPKRVPLTPEHLFTSAENIAAHLGLTETDVAVHGLPMFHVGAFVDLLLAPLLSCGSVTIAKDMHADALAEAVLERRGTWLQLVPTMLAHCLSRYDDQTARKLGGQLRFVRMVSADLGAALQGEAEARFGGTPFIQMYGMTETAGQIASNALPPAPRVPQSVGAAAGAEIKILDETGALVEPGEEGEICVDGPAVMDGYEGDTETPRHGRWFRTGDLGRLDADGALFLTGRRKEMINRGGEKISPLTVERAALDLPSVREAVAFAVPHDTLGEQVGLAIAGDLATMPTSDVLIAQLRERVSDPELPRQITRLDAMPRLPSGKVDRRQVAIHGRTLEAPPLPVGATALLVQNIWTEILGTGPAHADADFFDSGGDSLSATEFIEALQSKRDGQVNANLLFETPRFADLVSALEEASAPAAEKEGYLQEVRRGMAGWQGQRVGPRKLLIAQNTVSEAAPIFFCMNGMENALAFAATIGKDHPFYMIGGMLRVKKGVYAHLEEISGLYAEEIRAVTQGAPVILAGFCVGVHMARAIATHLRAAGQDVSLMVSIDREFEVPVPYPVFHTWTDSDRFSALGRFYEPERAFGFLHPAGAAYAHIPGNHLSVLTEENYARIAPLVRPYLNGAALPVPTQSDDTARATRQRRYKARLQLSAPRIWRTDRATHLRVRVTNQSTEVWMPTAQSGLRLTASFHNFDGHPRKMKAARANLEEVVQPGGVWETSLQVTYPDTGMPLRLRVSMIDDGYGYFEEFGGKAASKTIWCWPRRS